MTKKSLKQHLEEAQAFTSAKMTVLDKARRAPHGGIEILVRCPRCGSEVWVRKWNLFAGQKACACRLGRNVKKDVGTYRGAPVVEDNGDTVRVSRALITALADSLTSHWKNIMSASPLEFEVLKERTTELYYTLRGEHKHG